MQIASMLRPLFITLAFAGTVDTAAAQARPGADLALATATVNVRKGPGTRFPVVDILHRGEEVEVVQCRSNFCLIRHAGPQGWVSQNYLQRLIVKPR